MGNKDNQTKEQKMRSRGKKSRHQGRRANQHESNEIVTALYADGDGEIYDAPNVAALAKIGNDIVELTADDLIPLPPNSELMLLPGRLAMGRLPNGEAMPLSGTAVAAMLPVGYTRTHLPAFKKDSDDAAMLPLYGYTAVALYHDEICAAAVYTDENDKWEPHHYNTDALKKLIDNVKKELPNNRLVDHLAHCSLEYHCQTAQNLFYHRWEAGIPVSPACNANCLGCISLQPAECCPSPQSRIAFRPTVEEVAGIGAYHLSSAPDAIISFGQGCEGEPSLEAGIIADAIKLIRARTKNGEININSNAGYTDGIKKIVDAGLDTIRVSIISARAESYEAYYRSSYSLDDVKASIRYCLDNGVYVSLNLLYFPGFNDRPEEISAWQKFLNEYKVHMIQMRNLNFDPDVFLASMPKENEAPLGTKRFLKSIRESCPEIFIGSFSHYHKK